ncbi:Protein involved in sister chromatid separation and/or segregation [Ceraceosorus bombacis]|uniref:Protein involved in sister chromatid separation and/or segregation n=1 Tax=Ceraceosorus bombacis TaxID=401625 RepID=A0A0P1BQS7_9BASI|nr:Protein involved in sister chromatid separation and/or segregation [Ceraceosorus bombacis]
MPEPSRLFGKRATEAGRATIHTRLNDPDTQRNPYINFVEALPQTDGSEHEALERLQNVCAMLKPLMREHGFKVNTLQEHEPNKEFLGRCWNNGEVIELVLRRMDDPRHFLSLQFVCMVFCHELAHIHHMNHAAGHTTLTKNLCSGVRKLQSEGYTGDGFWSAGQRVADASCVEGISQLQPDCRLPQALCGGASRRSASGSAGRKRVRQSVGGRSSRGFQGPSGHTGAQTARNVDPSSGKSTRRNAREMPGGGGRVDGRDWLPTASAKSDDYKKDRNSTFRKQANSKSARDLRAEATERRLRELGGAASAIAGPTSLSARRDRCVASESGREDEKPEVESLPRVQSAVSHVDTSTRLGTSASKGSQQLTSQERNSRLAQILNKERSWQKADSASASASAPLPVRVSTSKEKLAAVARPLAKPLERAKGSRAPAHQLGSGATWGDLHRAAHTSNATLAQGQRPGVKDWIERHAASEGNIAGQTRSADPSTIDLTDDVGHQSSAASPKWTCKVCTLINQPTPLRCAACNTCKGSSNLGE